MWSLEWVPYIASPGWVHVVFPWIGSPERDVIEGPAEVVHSRGCPVGVN